MQNRDRWTAPTTASNAVPSMSDKCAPKMYQPTDGGTTRNKKYVPYDNASKTPVRSAIFLIT